MKDEDKGVTEPRRRPRFGLNEEGIDDVFRPEDSDPWRVFMMLAGFGFGAIGVAILFKLADAPSWGMLMLPLMIFVFAISGAMGMGVLFVLGAALGSGGRFVLALLTVGFFALTWQMPDIIEAKRKEMAEAPPPKKGKTYRIQSEAQRIEDRLNNGESYDPRNGK